jgi:hypothetical protein
VAEQDGRDGWDHGAALLSCARDTKRVVSQQRVLLGGSGRYEQEAIETATGLD